MIRQRTLTIQSDRSLTLAVAEAGEPGAPLVVFLHGFPDTWECWRAQMTALADRYHVVAPNQRGYPGSDKPRGVASYAVELLAGDVVALIRALGKDRAAVVGHDWGGLVAWQLGIGGYPEVERLAILNAPHPTAFKRHAKQSSEQRAMSWYMLAFQLPGAPELLLRATDDALLRKALRGGSRKGSFSEGELDRYAAGWKEPGARTGMINWYRAALRHPPKNAAAKGRVTVPTALLWGAKDPFLSRPLAELSLGWCDRGALTMYDDASHWVQKDAAEAVTERLRAFLAEA